MEKLPQEIISEIVSNLESCKDILNFCMTNSKNKEQCKKDSIYMIKKVIEKKYPQFKVHSFVKQISEEYENLNNDLVPFSYLEGKGIYQEEFDTMPNIKIARYNPYKWNDIKNSLLHISYAIKTNSLLKRDQYTALARSINIHIKLPDTLQETVSLLTGGSDLLSTQINDFDKFIYLFLVFNKSKWAKNDYEKYNIEIITKQTKDYILIKEIKFDNTFPFIHFKKGITKEKFILTILCKILSLFGK